MIDTRVLEEEGVVLKSHLLVGILNELYEFLRPILDDSNITHTFSQINF